MENKYIIYGLIDPRTNEIRYIGKSTRGVNTKNLLDIGARLEA